MGGPVSAKRTGAATTPVLRLFIQRKEVLLDMPSSPSSWQITYTQMEFRRVFHLLIHALNQKGEDPATVRSFLQTSVQAMGTDLPFLHGFAELALDAVPNLRAPIRWLEAIYLFALSRRSGFESSMFLVHRLFERAREVEGIAQETEFWNSLQLPVAACR